MLENEITSQSSHYGIEREGLVDSLIRFRILLKFLDDRSLHQLNTIQTEQDKQHICEEEKIDLKNEFRNSNESNYELKRKVTDLTNQIKILTEEKRRLQAKVNNNAPTLDGKTGAISGTNTIEMISTPEKIQPSLTVTRTSDVSSLDTQATSPELNDHRDKESPSSSSSQNQVNEGQDKMNHANISEPTRRTSPRLSAANRKTDVNQSEEH